MSHIPVLLDEVIEHLAPCQLSTVFDGTCGAGGHAKAILEAHPEVVQYTACDQDTEALCLSRATLAPFHAKVVFYHNNFSGKSLILFLAISQYSWLISIPI